MKKAGLVVVLLAVALGALLLLLRGGARTGPIRMGAGETERAIAASEELVLAEGQQGARPAREEARMRDRTEDLVPEPPPPPLVIQGTVVVADGNGVENAHASGELTLWVDILGGGRTRHDLTVGGGSWTLEVPGTRFGHLTGTIVPSSCTLEGRTAVPVRGQEEGVELPDGGRLALRMRWLPDALLHVRDRATGRELENVFLYEAWNRPDYAVRPGDMGDVEGREVGASPVVIPAPEHANLYPRGIYAKSPGYAWGLAEIPVGGGEHELRLDPAGELELVIDAPAQVDWPPARAEHGGRFLRREVKAGIVIDAAVSLEPGGPRIRLFPTRTRALTSFFEVGADLYLDQSLTSERSILLKDLPVGSYTAEARMDRGSSLLLGSVETRVTAGARARAVLSIQPSPSSESVPFEGVLVLPEEWELGKFSLRFSYLLGRGSSEDIHDTAIFPDPGTRDRFRWSVPNATPGYYMVQLRELGFQALLDVGTAGTRDARIDVPPPCLVHARCVDARDGRTVTTEVVKWACVSVTVMVPSTWDPAERCWSFRAPAGPIHVVVDPGRYARTEVELEVGAGMNEVELRLEPTLRVRVVLRDGQQVVPWKAARLAELVPLEDGDDSDSELELEDDALVLHVPRPGKYVLLVPKLPGYLAVPERTIEVEHDMTEVIELEKKP